MFRNSHSEVPFDLYIVPSNPSTQTLKDLSKQIKRDFTKFSYITLTNEIMAITDALDVLSDIATSRNFTGMGVINDLVPEDIDQMEYREKMIYSCAISQYNIIFKHITYKWRSFQFLTKSLLAVPSQSAK